MHTTTFYSYKGGVGRTLALMNVAAEICSHGENVFLIDFDLEAPGLQTFEPFKRQYNINSETELKGLSDLVLEYISNPSAGIPSIEPYILEGQNNDWADSELGIKPGKLYLLPAGTKTAFSKINWQTLYSELDGFLFFELLKDHIANYKELEFPWLLIDSRTGRAETTGICTRQLADTNVLVFFPNEQNRVGFEEIFPKIVDEPSRKADGVSGTNFVFVASRVPTTDDENDILSSEMLLFRKLFGLKKVSQENIHDANSEIIYLPHNNSLELIEQELFVLSRKRSLLGQKYVELSNKLKTQNPYSKSGALKLIETSINLDTREFIKINTDEFLETLLRISIYHIGDLKINFGLSILYDEMNQYSRFLSRKEKIRQNQLKSFSENDFIDDDFIDKEKNKFRAFWHLAVGMSLVKNDSEVPYHPLYNPEFEIQQNTRILETNFSSRTLYNNIIEYFVDFAFEYGLKKMKDNLNPSNFFNIAFGDSKIDEFDERKLKNFNLFKEKNLNKVNENIQESLNNISISSHFNAETIKRLEWLVIMENFEKLEELIDSNHFFDLVKFRSKSHKEQIKYLVDTTYRRLEDISDKTENFKRSFELYKQIISFTNLN